MQFIQQLVAGVGTGMIYGALALALVFAYRSTGVANFAQGNMGLLVAYLCWSLHDVGVSIVVSVVIALVAALLIGAISYACTIWPLRHAPHEAAIPATVGLFLFLLGATGYLWGYLLKPFPSLFGETSMRIAGAPVDSNSIGIIVLIAALLLILFVVFDRTRFGLALRAVGQEPELSRYVGIRVSRMLLIGWSIAAGLGGLAAILAAPALYLQPSMMLNVLIYALAAATLAGFDNSAVAVGAGIVLGVSQNLTTAYVDALGGELSVLIPFAIVLLVLSVRPAGVGVRVARARA